MLSRYKNLEQIGAGGMGVVYRAEDVSLRRPVAVKFLTGTSYAEEQRRARFLREARMAAALNHPNICTVYEVGEVRPGEEAMLGGEQRLDPGGRPQIWRVPVSGGTARPFEGSEPSQSGPGISWNPGSQVAYLTPGNRNIQLLDPESGKIRSLIEDESAGWIFDPVFSPDGKKLVAFRNLSGDSGRGFWVFSLDGKAAEKIWDIEDALPRRWSDDGAWIYATEARGIFRCLIATEEPVHTSYRGVEVYKLTHWV